MSRTPEQIAQAEARQAEIEAGLLATLADRDPGPVITRQPGVYDASLPELRRRHPGVAFKQGR
jgi:hypothetical protein